MAEAPAGYREVARTPRRILSKPLSYALHYKLTLLGRYLFLGLAFAILSSSSSVDIPIFHFGCVLIALFMVSVGVGWFLRPRLQTTVRLPDRMSAGDTAWGAFTVRNRGLLNARDLSVFARASKPDKLSVFCEDIRPTAERGKKAELGLAVRAPRRGRYELPRLAPCSLFPFGLVRSASRLAPSCDAGPPALLVYPRFTPLVDVDIAIGPRYQPGGIALTSNVGESPEYIGNREYRTGDPLRRIDFRSWGRLGRPVVREYQEEYYCRVALVLDTFIPRRVRIPASGAPGFEGAVSLAASVADAMARGEHVIDIFAAGPELYVFRSGRHTSHFDNVLDILACVDACRRNPFGKVTPALAEELNRISAVVCVLLDWDDARETMVRAAAEAGCAVKVAVVRDGPTTKPFDTAAQWAQSVVQLAPGDIAEGRVERL